MAIKNPPIKAVIDESIYDKILKYLTVEHFIFTVTLLAKVTILTSFYCVVGLGVVFIHYFLFLLLVTGGDNDEMIRISREHTSTIRQWFGFSELATSNTPSRRSRLNLSTPSMRSLNRPIIGATGKPAHSLTQLVTKEMTVNDMDEL